MDSTAHEELTVKFRHDRNVADDGRIEPRGGKTIARVYSGDRLEDEVKKLHGAYTSLFEELSHDDRLYLPNSYRWEKLTAPDLRVEHADITREISQEMRRLRELKGLSSLTIEEQFLALEEELLYGGLKSDQAHEFLARIPTVDMALPSPTEAKQLLAGA